MVLNRKGRRQSLDTNLSKNWEMTKAFGSESLTRPLASLINQFNNPKTPTKAINPSIRDVVINKQHSSPSEKSVKTIIQENKFKKKALMSEKQKQVYPAFGPKSFTVETRKSDLSEAFSKLILTRQNETKAAKIDKIGPKVANENIIMNRLASLKPVELKTKPSNEKSDERAVPLKSIKAKKALFDKEPFKSEQQAPQSCYSTIKVNIAQTNLKKIPQAFLPETAQETEPRKKFAFFLKPSHSKIEAETISLMSETVNNIDDGFTSLSLSGSKSMSNEIYFSRVEPTTTINRFKDFSSSFQSCSSILPRTSLSENDTMFQESSLPISDINDLIGIEDDDSDIDVTLNNSVNTETLVSIDDSTDEESLGLKDELLKKSDGYLIKHLSNAAHVYLFIF